MTKITKFRIWDKVPEESTFIFEDTSNSQKYSERNLQAKMSLIRAAVSIQYRRVTDRQTDRQTHTHDDDDDDDDRPAVKSEGGCLLAWIT